MIDNVSFFVPMARPESVFDSLPMEIENGRRVGKGFR